MAGINPDTGKVEHDNWRHTVRCIETILTTNFGERVERRHIGSILPRLLGQNLTPDTFLRFLAAIPQDLAVIELNGLAREPRYEVTHSSRYGMTGTTARQGRVGLMLNGIWRPFGHLGDPTPAGYRALNLFAERGKFILEPAA